MSKSEDSKGNMRITSPDDGQAGCLKRFVIAFLVLLAISIVTICVLVRLEGPQSIIEDWLTDHIGLEMSISGARIGLPFVLVLDDPLSEDFDLRTNGGFAAREIRIGFGSGFHRYIAIKKGALVLARKNDDIWQPSEFTRCGSIPMVDLGEISRATSLLRNLTKLHIEDSSIEWINGDDGERIASVDGLSFDMQPAGIPSRKMYHYQLMIYRGLHPDGSKVENMEREWLASESTDYIELHRSSDRVPLTVSEFWNPKDTQCVER